MNEDGVPAEVLRRREMFAKLREEVKRLKPDEVGVSIDMTEAEMLNALKAPTRRTMAASLGKMATTNANYQCHQPSCIIKRRRWTWDLV